MLCTDVRLAVSVLLLCAAQSTLAQSIQPGTLPVRLQNVGTVTVTSNGAPNFGVHTNDPRFLYVGQQSGIIRILDFNQTTPLITTNFLNIGSALGGGIFASGFEKGLIGGAFHPDFNVEGSLGYRKFYTHTSETIGSGTPNFFHQSETGFTYDHQGVIREWTVGGPNQSGVMTVNTSIASRVVMRIAQPQSNHNGGSLAFGPDKNLYIALGDGGEGNDFRTSVNSNTDGHTNQQNPDTPGGFLGHGNGQDRRNVYGKILRIQPLVNTEDTASIPNTVGGGYRIPIDNPFTEAAQTENPVPGWQANWVDEVYAYGLRNPFRISFDREVGTLIAADVGQSAREEVNLIESGGNYGWVAREGRIQNPSFPISNPLYAEPSNTEFLDPVAEYPNGNGGGAATMGGFVYRGHTLGLLDGKYVFGEYARSGVTGGGMMYTDITGPGPNQVFDLPIQGTPGKPGSNLHGIGEDANGEIYYMFGNGQIVKLLPVVTGLAGDYNNDRVVNEKDFLAWKASYLGKNLFADGNGDGVVDAADYTIWRDNVGNSLPGGAASVPEPTALLLSGWLFALLLPRRRRRGKM